MGRHSVGKLIFVLCTSLIARLPDLPLQVSDLQRGLPHLPLHHQLLQPVPADLFQQTVNMDMSHRSQSCTITAAGIMLRECPVVGQLVRHFTEIF